jgi:hypothetical protein
VSVNYLGNYGNEYRFRYRQLANEGLFDTLLKQAVGA